MRPQTPQPSTSEAGGAWKPALLLTLGFTFLYGWFATAGTWDLFAQESFGAYYDSLARSLKQGRLDVEGPAISGEAFIVDGRRYGYFGPTPALPRMLIQVFWRDTDARLSRLFVILAGLSHLWLAMVLLRRLGVPLSRPLPLFFLISVGAGTTTLFLVCRPFIYHEALIWGSGLALAAGYFALSYLIQPARRFVWGAVICAFLAFWARITVGAAALLACAVLLLHVAAEARRLRQDSQGRLPASGSRPWDTPYRERLVRCAILAGGLALSAASFLYLNYVRFGSWWESMPIRYNSQYVPERMARLDGRLMHPEFAAVQFYEILSPTSIEIRRSFPFVTFHEDPSLVPPPFGFDHTEPYAGLLAVSPGLAVLAVLGVLGGALLYPHPWIMRLVVLALASALAPLLCFPTLAHRYSQDLVPGLVACGALGVAYLAARSRLRRYGLRLLMYTLLLWAVPINLALTLVYQNEIVWGVNEASVARYRRWQSRVNVWIWGHELPSQDWNRPEGRHHEAVR